MNTDLNKKKAFYKCKEVCVEYEKVNKLPIPKDWVSVKLGKISSFKQGFQIPREEQITDFQDDYIRYLYINDFFSDKNKLFIKDDQKYYKINKEDICVANTGNTAGKSFRGAEGILSNNMFKISPDSSIDIDFYWQFLNSEDYWKKLNNIFNSGGQPHVGHQNMSNIVINLPPLLEQQKIASILSTWDKAIGLKEQLIEEKKQQKKGLMKKLLTGKVRLPGFKGDWQYVQARKLFQNITDKKHNGLGNVLSANQERGIILRSEGNIDIKYDEDNLKNYKKVRPGEFVISLRSFQGGIEYSKYEGLLSPAYTIIRNIIPIDDSFYKHFFKSTDFITRLNGMIYGIRDGKQISFKDFAVLKLPYTTVEEQTAIGKVLECSSQEISLLEQELAALKLQKKGLMQLLLTGIVRVQC